ncbi:MAG TPA: hypothetical protein VE398_09055, partial [Acidobacteriota bacterium]|nr:hypothetical protein [Acidobacteriota bacterium]
MIRQERFVALGLSLLAVFLHVVFLLKAGGLWRDEANSVALAFKPSLAEMWSAMRFDSFPILHFILVRFWSELFGSSDASLRGLGFIVGLAIIAVFWLNSDRFGCRSPLVPLLLIGLSPVMIRSLDAIRPNGLATLTTILAFAAVWSAVCKPDAF